MAAGYHVHWDQTRPSSVPSFRASSSHEHALLQFVSSVRSVESKMYNDKSLNSFRDLQQVMYTFQQSKQCYRQLP